MPRMAPSSRVIQCRITPEMAAALDEFLAREGGEQSDLVRRAVLTAIGRDDLADKMPAEGRPRKPECPSAPRRRRRSPH